MLPIHQLLARIEFDREFARGAFEIAYLDRRRMGLVRIPFERIVSRGAFGFEAEQEDGTVQSIPYHRVREVRRDGAVIWLRLARAAPARRRNGELVSRGPAARPPASPRGARRRKRDARRRHTP
jgi:uncharacterized protein (UPF0248 family)